MKLVREYLFESIKLDSNFVKGWNNYKISHNKEIIGELEISNREDHIILNRIFIEPEHRKMGYANEVMKILLKYANDQNKIIGLTPDEKWGISKKQLKRWYSSLGFVINKGRNADYRINSLMLKYPK